MDKKSIIVVTGAAGFIGSCMVQFLNENGYENLIIVDDFGVEEKRTNWEAKKFINAVERQSLFEWLQTNNSTISCFIHLGARTDTTEFNYAIHEELNVEYSKNVWHYCVENNVPLIYASSAATYGAGEFGYDDNHELPYKLQPLNPYGISKNEFDKWALEEASSQPSPNGEGVCPPFWAGLKFFNVYGPNEYHKARMASMIFHGYHQIKKEGFVKLFKSHKQGFADGEQLRDFIYVKDVIKIMFWMMQEAFVTNGIYNVGTGKARSFNDLVNATFAAMDIEAQIKYIDIPEDIRDKYQYFTEAKMEKIRLAGYTSPLYSLEEGISDYVKNYLINNRYY